MPQWLRLSEWLGGAGGAQRILLGSNYLTDAYEVAVRVNDCKLPKTSWFVLQDFHAGNTGVWQLGWGAGTIKFLYIQDTDVATGR